MKNYTIQELKAKFKVLGHVWPSGIHIIGIRAAKGLDNQFCDQLMVFAGDAFIIQGVGTTVPGRPYLLKPINPKGCAILKEGQYLNCWRVGLHNSYEALIQCAPVTVYRDANRDQVLDMNPKILDRGIFNIDIHHAGQNFLAKFIDNFSAGCSVWQNIKEFNLMMTACKGVNQNYFSYTLLNEF